MAETPQAAADDEALVRRVRAGEIEAYGELVDRHRALVWRIVGGHVPAGDVGEVAHEVFVDAFRSLGSFVARRPFSHWLSRIASRRCCDFWRARQRRREWSGGATGGGGGDEAGGTGRREWLEALLAAPAREAFEREGARAEARETLDWALARLRAEDRMVVTLVHLEGRPVREVAGLMGWSAGGVKVRALRARRALRTIIGKLIGETGDGPDGTAD